MTWGFAASFWASEGSHRYECLLSSPVPFWQVPQSLARHSTALRKNHWSCSVHQEYPRDAMQGKMKCCYAFGLPARGRKCAIAADFSGHAHFFRQESLLQLHWRTSGFSSGNFNATCSSMPGWGGSGLADLFARTSHSNKLPFLEHLTWHNCSMGVLKYIIWHQ